MTNASSKANRKVAKLLRRGYELKARLDELKAELAEISAQVAAAAVFGGKKVARVSDGEFIAEIHQKSRVVWNQDVLGDARAVAPSLFDELFVAEFKPAGRFEVSGDGPFWTLVAGAREEVGLAPYVVYKQIVSKGEVAVAKAA